jgi:ABC-type transport system substrate-binding protein
MSNKKLMGVAAALAFVALAGAVPAAQAQTMAAPASRVMVPMQAPPAEVDVYSSAPVADPGDSNWSARQNVADSQRYESLVHSNPGFRAARIQKECGPITEPDLHQQCVASFNN